MRDKNIWIFNAGNAFSGNPKWLFMYLNEHHPEIELWWFCYDRKLVNYMKERGFNACLFDSHMAKQVGRRAGVYVVNMYKVVFQDYLEGISILNLWHGVGCKTVELGVTSGFLHEEIVAKHICNRRIYNTQQLFLVTSPLMEEHFKKQCGIDDDKLVRAGYPCCSYPGTVTTFDHDIRTQQGLPADTKLVAYVPTYRDNEPTGFLSKALPDIARLVEALAANDMAIIMKMHPKMEADPQYLALKNTYESEPRIIFWDNANDFYEVFDQIHTAIIDYSSIFYDMLAGGVRHFIRYFYDLDEGETVRDFVFDVREMTCGIECTSFDELLAALSMPNEDLGDVERINDLFWSYATPDSCEKIVQAALAFEPDTARPWTTLYSYDIFDTLIARTTLKPEGVFELVQERLVASGEPFPAYLTRSYPEARRCCEQNCREYVVKTVYLRDDDRTEIDFDMIFERLKVMYGIDDHQAELLKQWELEAELRVSVPIKKTIDEVRRLVASGETVVLISDMYLDKDFIAELLRKADPMLAELPLYVSSDVGLQKSRRTLYHHVFHDIDYRFDRWVHRGDNEHADINMPEMLGITPNPYTEGILSSFHADELIEAVGTFDSYQVGRLISRFEMQHGISIEDRFAYCYASLFFVPYVAWAIRDALAEGTDCLYFISRDGYHLKRIADAIIEVQGLSIKTKYIYGSRKAWRVPSQIDDFDADFFTAHGNFAGLLDFNELVSASLVERGELLALFPELKMYESVERFEPEDLESIRMTLGSSQTYRKRLLERAAEERTTVCAYLDQEIDFSEKFAFVEFWGRGYTQTCLSRLLHSIDSRIEGTTFYYARSIYPTEGADVRKNISASHISLLFIEAIFANMPIRTVPGYQRAEDGSYEPIIYDNDYNTRIFDALDKYLPQFAADFAALDLYETTSALLELYNFGIGHFRFNATQDIYLKCIAPLKDSVTIYGKGIEFAPAWTAHDALQRVTGTMKLTKNRDMSLARSNLFWKAAFKVFTAGKGVAEYIQERN